MYGESLRSYLNTLGNQLRAIGLPGE